MEKVPEGAHKELCPACHRSNDKFPAGEIVIAGAFSKAHYAEILALVQDLHQRLGATVLIVTHDTNVAGSCSRTIALRDGRIVEDRRR